ncbi:conserved hypothetical protein [Candida dubliniensis CD36]|uniref:FAS1 domain-containing protein n=1 Tax=Candida dubliniensis (strain CD36 / ATCC MYA-646 / CBS 7987 / NCPF 3949 / NRRL Y-17841) TaxID=573826 RepID=B9WJQ2_CANDC|nr:conserved hypothetical protein [Candida dubliniensis CD36]CAX40599.1 conserved hypothetical protein [Candida dubliniensis CD36]
MKPFWIYIFLFIFSGVRADESTTSASSSVEPAPTPSTLVDILSARPQFSYFLRLLQRQGMIPTLNQMKNVTLLAPINSAFVGEKSIDWDNNGLNRYIVNQKLRVGLLGKSESVYETLYKVGNTNYSIAVSPDFESLEYVIDDVSYIVEEDVYAKHQYSYIQGIDHLLPEKPTICEVLMNNTNPEISLFSKIFQSLFLDIDEQQVQDKRKKKNHKKPKKTKLPPLPNSCNEFLNGTRTIIAPSNKVLKNSLTDIQLRYYLSNSDFARYASTTDSVSEIKHDVMSLLQNLMFPTLIVGANNTNSKIKSNSGKSHKFKLEDGHVKIDKVAVSESHVSADGVIHIFKDTGQLFYKLNIPTAEMIARKSLYALHYSNFVDELYFRSLGHLVDGSSENQSIFLDINQRDDVEDDDVEGTMVSFSSKQSILYQFVDGKIDVHDSMHSLLDTKLCSKKKIGGCFKLKFSTSHGKNNITVNDEVHIQEYTPIANDSFIFVANGEITPPVNLKHSLGDLISSGAVHRHLENIEIDQGSCLRTLEYINRFGLSSLRDNDEGYSIFLPCGTTDTKGTWKDLGLILTYLERNPHMLEMVVKSMFMEGMVYSDFASHKKLQDLNGNQVKFKSWGIADDVNEATLNNTQLSLPLNSDLLFQQGVIHVTNKVFFPDDFEVPIEELIKTTYDSNFPNFFMWDILKMYPNIKNVITGEMPYSLLIPTAESLKDFNVTTSMKDLLRFIDFHLIPNSEVGKILDCISGVGYNKSVFRTNLSEGGLICKHKPQTNKVMLQLHKLNTTSAVSYNKDQEVRLLSHGCTKNYRNETDQLSCVFLIQKPLNLQWFERPNSGDNFLHVHLGLVSVGVGVILGLIIFGGVMVGLMFCIGKREKNDNKDDFEFPRSDAGFMSVLTDDDEFVPYDRGYETDVDVLRTETDALLPSHMKRKKRVKKPDYGSTKQGINGVTLPRDIGDIRSTLNRERNLPGYSQY